MTGTEIKYSQLKFYHYISFFCDSSGCFWTQEHFLWTPSYDHTWSWMVTEDLEHCDHRKDLVHDWCFPYKEIFYMHISVIQGFVTESFCYTLWNEKLCQAVGNGIRSAICCSQVTQLHTSTFPFSANVLCWIKLHSWNSCGWRFAKVQRAGVQILWSLSVY